jgi:tetratricopeptide (TPR) repeat protein
MKKLTILFLGATLALSFAGSLIAQVPVGVRIRGTVQDSEGNPIAGALVRVEVFEEDTSLSSKTTTSKKGKYGMAIMHPSRMYRFTVEKEGYLTHEEVYDIGSARVDLNAPFKRDFVLERGDQEGALGAALLDNLRHRDPAAKPYGKGVEAFNSENWSGARKQFEVATQKSPNLLQAWAGLAHSCIRLEAWEDAIAAAEKVLAEKPRNRQMLEVLYFSYTKLGRELDAAVVREAIEELEAEVEAGTG